MEHRWMRLYKDGVWTGGESRMVTLKDGKEYSIDDLAVKYGLDLPDTGAKPVKKSKKTINTVVDIQEIEDEDMDRPFDHRDHEQHDRGDSED